MNTPAPSTPVRVTPTRARYRHKRALARFAAGKRTQPVPALVVPAPFSFKKTPRVGK